MSLPTTVREFKKEVSRSTYGNVHYWLREKYGHANRCEDIECSHKSSNYSWALKKGCRYEKNRDNFLELCRSCHAKYDMTETTSRIASLTHSGRKLAEYLKSDKYKPIDQFSLDGQLIKTHKAIMLAAKEVNIPATNLSSAARGRIKTCKGFIWKYHV